MHRAVEVLTLIALGVVFLSLFIGASRVMLLKKESVKNVLHLVGQKTEVFIKAGCYTNEEVEVITHDGVKFLCGKGKIVKMSGN